MTPKTGSSQPLHKEDISKEFYIGHSHGVLTTLPECIDNPTGIRILEYETPNELVELVDARITAIVGLFCALSIYRGNACLYTTVKDVKQAGSMEDVQRFLKD